MATIFKTVYNSRETPDLGEVNTLPSETQPDKVMTIKEMLARHVRGLPVSGGSGFVDIPEEVGYIPDIRSLDLTEIDEYAKHFKEVSETIQNPHASTGSAADTEGMRPAPETSQTQTDPPKQPAEGANS